MPSKILASVSDVHLERIAYALRLVWEGDIGSSAGTVKAT